MALMGIRSTVALAIVAVLTGCAGRSPTQPVGFAPAPTTTAPGLTAPRTIAPAAPSAYGSTSPMGGLPGQVGMASAPGSLGYANTPAYGTQGTADPTAGTMSAQPGLTARVDKKKNGVVFGIGTFKVTVVVTNPGTVPQSGTLKVSITDKGKVLKDFSERVTVQPGQNLSKDFEDKRWKADDATVTVTTDAADPGIYGGY
jgi:hypothetical protein